MGKLGHQLFKLVESDQGYAFISDAVASLNDDRVLAIARGALRHSELVTVKLQKFLKAHDPKPKRCIAGCGGCERNMERDHQCTLRDNHGTEHSFECSKKGNHDYR